MKVFFVAILLISTFSRAFVQQTATVEALHLKRNNQAVMLDTPVVGKPCPDFEFQNVHFYPKKKVTLADFRGKWLILDFWTKYCVACLASFPHTNELQKKFAGKVQFLLVGAGSEAEIKPVYEKARSRLKLDLPVAIDTLVFQRFGIFGVPALIWIDEKGIVRAVTQSTYLTESNLTSFLNGKELDLPVKPTAWTYTNAQNASTNAITANLNEKQVLYTSELTAYQPGKMATMSNLREGTRIVRIMNGTLRSLFSLAYADKGDFYPSRFPNNRIILEVRDSLKFKYSNENLYCYTLIVPEDRTKDLLKIMRQDLDNLFNYSGKVEYRKRKIRALVCTDSSKLLTRGGKPLQKWGGDGIVVENKPVSTLADMLQYYLKSNPLVDETGYTGNVDISLDALMTNVADVRRSLQRYGLDLIEKEKEIEVLIIRDKLQ